MNEPPTTRRWRLIGYGRNPEGKGTVTIHDETVTGDHRLNTAIHRLEARSDITGYAATHLG